MAAQSTNESRAKALVLRDADVEIVDVTAQRGAFRWSLRWLAASAALLVVGVAAVALGATSIGAPAILGMGVASFVSAAYAAGSMTPKRRSYQADVRVTSSGLVVGDRAWKIPRDAIEGGIADDEELTLALHGGDELRIRARLRDRERARAAPDVLGLGPDERRAVVRWSRGGLRAAAYVIIVLAMIVAIGALGKLLGVFVFFALLPAFVAAWPLSEVISAREVVVGADEIRVRIGSRTTTVPILEVAEARADGRALVLVRRDGAALRLRVGDAAVASAVQRRIEAGLERAQSTWTSATVSRALARNGRDLESWSAALAGLVDGPVTHREAAITRDQIVRVITDSAADPEQRIAAALVLSAGTHVASREALRRAIETTASPALRVALEARVGGRARPRSARRSARAELRLGLTLILNWPSVSPRRAALMRLLRQPCHHWSGCRLPFTPSFARDLGRGRSFA